VDQKSSLKRARRVLRRNPLALLGTAEWPYLIVFGAAVIARSLILRYASLDNAPAEPMDLWRSMGPSAKVGIVLSYFFYTSVPQGFAVAGVSVVTWRNYRCGSTPLLHELFEVRPRFFSLIALSFLVGFVTTLLTSVVPVVGPFIMHTILLPAAVVVLIQEKPRPGVLAALRTSLSLTANSLAIIFGVVVVSVGAFVGLYAVLIRVTMSPGVPRVFVTFAVLASFILVVQPAVALILGVALTSSYCDRCFPATAPATA